MDALRCFRVFQKELLAAFRCLADADREGYSEHLVVAHRELRVGRASLSKRDADVLYCCAARTVDVLKKCSSLGLKNLPKRLEEYRLEQALVALLETRSSRKRAEIASNQYLLAA
ncbi:MAG: hypothetical protein KDD62_07205 [Bdellovibrionales bacterium]|nr:hypothetical protein [Bdellovibrionales bacterium]